MSPKADPDPARGTYQHYKGTFYEVLGMAEDPETGNRYVVYQSLGLMEVLLKADPSNHFDPQGPIVSTPTKGELAVSSVERFTEMVDGGAYHPGKKVPRFRLFAAV